MIEDEKPDIADAYRVTPAVRREVLQRDQYRCRRCGEQDIDKLTVHHVIYRSRGGGHDADNLVTVCWNPCHRLIHEKKVTVVNRDGHWFFGTVGGWRQRL